MVKGQIIKLSYYKNKRINLSAQQKEDKINKLTSMHIEAMITQKCLGGDVDLTQAFSKSRRDSKADLDAVTKFTDVETIYYQIGQQESYDELIKIENQPDFGGWVSPFEIEEIKSSHN